LAIIYFWYSKSYILKNKTDIDILNTL